MNVPNGLEHSPIAFWGLVVIAVVISVGAFFLLKRIKWF